MKYIFFPILVLTALLFLSCTNKNALYKVVTEEEYNKLQVRDTIFNLPQLLVTCTGSAGRYNDMETILVRKSTEDGFDYFILATDVYFENSTTLIEYKGFFSSDEDGAFQKNGIWVHTDFYNDRFESGMRFAVDSVPSGYDDNKRPVEEGIYFFTHDKLERISGGQSDEEFQKFGKDGFYFIPNSGRFFKRHSADAIK